MQTLLVEPINAGDRCEFEVFGIAPDPFPQPPLLIGVT